MSTNSGSTFPIPGAVFDLPPVGPAPKELANLGRKLATGTASAPVVLPTAGGPETPADAVRFLNQATFGASPETIDELLSLGSYSAWIDRQLTLTPSATRPFVAAAGNSSNSNPRHHIWWQNLMEQPDQLRQRMAFAWSQIFVVSDRDYILSNSQYGMCNYYDMLAAGAFGNFRTLLEQVTLHPVMGVYLSMLRNEKADRSRNIRPDENFAREVLQLFTIGLWELAPDGQPRTDSAGQPIPTFDQVLVEEFAKVFTGWNFDNVRSWTDNNIPQLSRETPMVADEAFHDTTAKTLLGGETIPSGGTAQQDLTAALDNIFNHQNVGPFVAHLLIQRLVTSNPTPEYVGRVAAAFANNGQGVRGDLEAVTRAILLDPEARDGHTTQPDTFGKVKEPIMRLSQVWRAFDAQPGPEADGVYRPYATSIETIETVTGQGVMRSPSVFNFFLPDNPIPGSAPGSTVVAPEMQILTEINIASTNNMLLQQIYSDNHTRDAGMRAPIAQIQLQPEVAMAGDIDVLLDHLDTLLMAGQLPPGLRAAIRTQIATHPTDAEGLLARVTDAIYGMVGSPFHLVQK